jgi:glycosyltransferase involved in cell wall biosynthesis
MRVAFVALETTHHLDRGNPTGGDAATDGEAATAEDPGDVSGDADEGGDSTATEAPEATDGGDGPASDGDEQQAAIQGATGEGGDTGDGRSRSRNDRGEAADGTSNEGARRIERLARQLAERGHEVGVFCAKTWRGGPTTTDDVGVTYYGVTQEVAPTSFGLRLPWKLAGFGPDVIHATPAPAAQVVAASFGGTLARAPLLLEYYGDADPAGSRWADRALAVPDRIVTPSEMVRTTLRERGVEDDRLVHIPEGIDVERLRDAEPEDGVDVAFAHPLDGTSNLESLLLGLAELRDKDWTATVIGDGPAREDYERQVRDLRIDDRVEFRGACDRDERLSIYRGAHAFVQTAYREYFATELLWALASGCVGIVEYQAESSAHELIENYDRSFRVTDPQTLADAIVDAGDLEPMDFDDSFERFDYREILESYLACYREVREEHGLMG